MQAIKLLITRNLKFPFFLFLLMISYVTKGQDNPDIFQEKKKLLDTAVRYGKLENGFTYYLRRHDKPKKTVEFHLVVKGGFFHENDDQVEYSHLMEHLATVRTKNFPNLRKHLREKMGGYNHAMTQNSHTFYWARLKSGDKEIQTGLKVLRDWAQNLDFPQNVVDVERGAVIGELRSSNSYSTWLNKIIEEKVLKSTGQVGYDSKKKKSNIEQFNRKAFLDFYKDWYRPDLEAAIIVGDINVDSMEHEVKKLFSDLRMPKKPKNGEELVDAQRIELSGENTFQIIQDTVNRKFRMDIISKHLNKKSFGLKIRSDYKKWLMQELYKEMVESRSRLLEEQFDPPFSEFRLSFDGGGYGKDKEINGIRMQINFGTEDKQQIKKKFIQAVVAWKQIHTNFSISELQKAKEQVQKRYVGKEITSHDLAEEYRHHFVEGNAAFAPEVKEKLIISLLDEIKLQGLQNVILEYGDLDKNTDFLVFKDKKGGIPKFKEFKQWLKEVKMKEVSSIEPFEPLESLSDVIQFPLGKNEPIKSKSNNLIGVTTVILQNGIKVLFKPSDPASQRHKGFVTIDAFRLNEVPISNGKEFLAAMTVPNYMENSGVGPLTKFDIDRFMREKEIRFKFFADAKYQRIYARSKEKDIKELLNLLYLYVAQPKKDPEGFVGLKDDYEQTFKGFVTHSGLRFTIDDKIEFLRYPEVPVLGLSDLEKLSLDDVFAAYNRWFSDLSGYTFIITGDFKTEQILPVVNENLTVFPISTKKAEHIDTPKFPLKKINEVIRLKNINQAFVRLYFPVSASRDVKTQIELELLTKALYERVWNRLRQSTYAPTTGGDWMDVKNNIFAFSMNFDSELGNEENMIRAATEELRKLRDNGVNQSWLDSAISDKTSTFARDLHTFGTFNFWRDYLKEKLKSYENIEEEVLQYFTILEHFTTLEDVNIAAKKYLSEENLQQFIFIPEYFSPETEDRFN